MLSIVRHLPLNITTCFFLCLLIGVLADEPEDHPPRGVFYYTDTERNLQSRFKLPNLAEIDPIDMASDLLSTAMEAKTKQKTISGIELPLTLTGKPLKLEIEGESREGMSMMSPNSNHQEHSIRAFPPTVRRSFLHVRQVCLQESVEQCDEALDNYHRIKYGKSLLEQEESSENGKLTEIIEKRLKQQMSTSTVEPDELEDDEDYVETTTKASLRTRFGQIRLHNIAH